MAVDGGYNAPWGKNDIISIPGNSQETATTTLLSLSVWVCHGRFPKKIMRKLIIFSINRYNNKK